ncbi:DUF2339 domain-containing protein [Sphingorhabdus lacus]|uniref:DUF2339 domain-containing protein n=1 Tax=Sphingorhabdus lacus TaxID=392610 RepID=UPI0035937A28
MTIALLFLGLFGLGFMLYLTRADMRFLHRRITELEERIALLSVAPSPDQGSDLVAAPTRLAAKARRTAVVTSVPVTPKPAVPAPPPPPSPPPVPSDPEEDEPQPSRFADLSFESLIGGKLPIWVGGISLVFAGFFLVRYTIEAGLFGPGARSVTATIFALAMIAMSELGGRLPKVGASFTADPRIAQSLAGAAVATLYGTLYMAAEIYGLLGVGTAFALVVVATIIAFTLSMRHGPPTALMGLVGGFAAPWVAGLGASNLPTLLLYLAVFMAALFGLAVWRRWLWLLVLASGGGLAWSFAMLATANGDLGLLGGFIAVTGGGAILAAKRFDDGNGPWAYLARHAPMALALVQLVMLMPKMDFSVLSWIFYFAVSALAIALAWRDKLLFPLVALALVLAIGPLSLAWDEAGASSSNIAMALAVAALFGIAGHVRGRSSDEMALGWIMVGLFAPLLCWFTAFLSHSSDSDYVWAGLALLCAAPAVWTAWEWHAKPRNSVVQPWATGAAALMLWVAAILSIDSAWAASYSAVVALGVAAWARITGGKWEERLLWIPLGMAMLLACGYSYRFFGAIGASLSGEGAVLKYLPAVSAGLRETLLPSLLIAAVAWTPVFAAGRRTRALALALGGAGVAAVIWLLAKQVAAIASPSDFIRLGFAERAVFTQMIFALGWLSLRQHDRQPDWPYVRMAGLFLAGLGLFRVIWFDLALHNPVLDPQAVGPVPVANLLTGHFALVAMWLWLIAREGSEHLRVPVQCSSLAMMVITTLGSIRQAMQGSLVSGAGIETGENYLYSAGLLALSIVWLFLGISRASKLLRIAGLVLLTVVTLKVFLVDAAALTGVLRILSFLGLGIALIGIGWAYGRVMGLSVPGTEAAEAPESR